MTVTSPDISIVDFLIKYDLSLSSPAVVVTNNCSGPHLGSCTYWMIITTPSGAVIHQGSETTPDHTGTWTTATYTTWPQPFGQVEFGYYTAELYVKDSVGNIFKWAKTINIVRPAGNKNADQKNYGVCTIAADVRCELSKMLLEDKSNYSWQGETGTILDQKWTVVFPLDDTGVQPDDFELFGAPNAIVDLTYSASGYQIVRTETRSYDLGDGQSVVIKYKTTQDLNVSCNIDLCPLLCEYGELMDDVACGKCTTVDSATLIQINGLMVQAIIGKMQPLCGVNVAAVVAKIKKLGNFSCNCNMSGNGLNGAGSATSFDYNIAVNGVCGDIDVESVIKVGSNITINLKDVSYVFSICDAADAAMKEIFTVGSSDNSGTCTKTYCLNIDKANLDIYLGSRLSGCCPYFISIKDKATGNAPIKCPLSYFPVNAFDYLGTTAIGIASSVEDLVGILNSDATWNVKGQAFVVDNCHVGFYRAAGVTTMSDVKVALISVTAGGGGGGACSPDNTKSYTIGLQNCDGSPFNGDYPFYGQVKYQVSGQLYSLGVVNSYVDMISKLNALGSKPPSITYSQLGTPSLIFVDDSNCSAGLQVQSIVITEVPFVVFGANHHSGVSTSPAMQVLDMKGAAALGKVCGLPNNKIPWHVFNVGDKLFTIESDSGLLTAINISDPLHPFIIKQITLTQVSGTEFTGVPLYNGTTPSHWDVYFPTDRDYNFDGFVYVMESTLGTIWKIDYNTITQVAAFRDALLIGACPRAIVNNRLYFSLDADRAVQTGQTAGIIVGKILKLNLAAFNAGGLALVNCGNSTTYVWSISHGYALGGFVYMVWVGQDGNVGIFDPVTDTLVGAVMFGLMNVVGGYTGLTNSTLYNGNLYVSSIGNGTKVADLSLVRQVFSIEAPGNNMNHYNFLPEKGKCWGYLTYDDGATPAGVAVVSLEGKLLDVVHLASGDIYNVIPKLVTANLTPNGFC